MIVCVGDIKYELMASLFEDRYRLERLIDYLPRAIVTGLKVDYLAYDFLLNDCRQELLRWFTK